MEEQRYTDIGSALLKRIAREEVVTVPGLGSMLLPGKVGFAEDNSWRFNPSYLPPTLAQYFTRFARRGPRCASDQRSLSLMPKALRQTGCATRKTKAGS